MTDEPPYKDFDIENAAEWGLLRLAFPLTAFIAGPPTAIQVFLKTGKMIMQSGIVSGTEDVLGADGRPERSTIFFADAEGIGINWTDVAQVLASVATTVVEGETDG